MSNPLDALRPSGHESTERPTRICASDRKQALLRRVRTAASELRPEPACEVCSRLQTALAIAPPASRTPPSH